MAPMIAARPKTNSPPITSSPAFEAETHPIKSGVNLSVISQTDTAFQKHPTKDSVTKEGTVMNGTKMTVPAPSSGTNAVNHMNGGPHPPPTTASSALLIQPSNVCKVIKGEIHNVLNVMRTDPRYFSTLRFMEEVPSDELHPLLLQLRSLHNEISEWELYHHNEQPKTKLYLTAFCDAIKGRDISASVTGAALQAIHKFLLYGFFASEGVSSITVIANTLLLCTFEESASTGIPEEGRAGIRGRMSGPASTNRDDEQVVLKLLDLSALVVRQASSELEPKVIVGLLDTCLHVSHRAKRASSLLKSAASDALAQIVLEVFSKPDLSKVRVAILEKLASLLNPQKNSETYVINSLTLVNIALETLTDELTETEVGILQNDLCKFLLSWSTTHDLVILSLTMRVIFNLFQTIRNHLKVPLEVFLTSVHLRILEHSGSHEEREVALESLLEFCQEPALMKDLYLNYDCDVNCTNLYASICATLGKVAVPSRYAGVALEMDKATAATKMNGSSGASAVSTSNTIAQQSAAAAAEVPLNALNVLAFEGLLTVLESISRRVKGASKDPSLDKNKSSGDSVDEEWISDQLTEEELQEQKRRKAAYTRVAEVFNKESGKDTWIKLGKDLKVMDGSAKSVANMFFKAPGLDKDKLGAYLGKGPAEKYPFHNDVRLAFVGQFDFSQETTFAASLRKFLHKFRMPGEAQQIDRFMEAFSKELYKQQVDKSVFKSADAVFVMAFSTIMLNTDLHNPQHKGARMTSDQFIKNNKGINDGEDVPERMLREIYKQIRDTELQVQREIGEFISRSDAMDAEHFRSAWGDLLSKNVAAAAFTTADDARESMNTVGVHEKDMFLVIAKPCLKGITSALVRSWDDFTVVSALKGLEQMARIATYFGLERLLNDIMSFLLSQGRQFIQGCVSLEYAGIDSGAPIAPSPEDDETMSIVDPDSPIPRGLMNAREIGMIDPKKIDIAGAAAYRGLLALNMGMKLVRTFFPRVRTAWPQLIGVVSSLRDARVLPPGLVDLDDFADSEGNVLPLSRFAQSSQTRLDNFYKGVKENDAAKKGWFRFGFRGKGKLDDGEPEPMPEQAAPEARSETLTANAKVLQDVCRKVEIEKLIVFGSGVPLPMVKHCVASLLDYIDRPPKSYSPTYEQHQAFALELAVRALLTHKDHALELLPLFMAKFEKVAALVEQQDEENHVQYPFLVERVSLSILRASIHLYQVQELRPILRQSLGLLARLPKKRFVQHVSDRIACGLAIILRNSYYMFKTSEDWKFLGDMFDTLASYRLGRGFTFDGLASTIEHALPALKTEDVEAYQEELKKKPTLSLPACASLMRILNKLIYGQYEKDIALAIPAMLCLDSTYKHMVLMILIRQSKEDPDADLDSVPDKDLWYKVTLAYYEACCSNDADISKQAMELCQKHVTSIFMEEIPDEKWIQLLNTMVEKQPPVKKDLARVNTFSLLGQMMVRLFPIMTVREANWQVLTEFTKNVVIIADENMQNSKKGSPLFNFTAKIVANLVKQMASKDFGGEKRYCEWASDTFKKALQKNEALKKKRRG